MKKILFMLIVLITLIMASVLYGTHSLIIEERESQPFEQAMAHYPETLSDILVDQVTALSCDSSASPVSPLHVKAG